MSNKYLEISEQTYNNFSKLKKTIEEMAGETVTEDEVVDFMIRSLMSSVELPDEEETCCCCHGHEMQDHHCHCDHH
mgnify:FL=1